MQHIQSALGVFLTLCLASWAAVAQESVKPEAPSALGQVLQHTVDTSPEVRASWQRFVAARAASRRARGALLPKLDLQGHLGADEQAFIEQNSTQHYDRRSVELSLTQLIYDGFISKREMDRLDEESRARYFQLLHQVEESLLDAVSVYNDVYRYRQLVRFASSNLDRHREYLELISSRARQGVSRTVDVEQATSRVALAESNLIVEQSNLHDVEARFQRIVGRPARTTLTKPAHWSRGLPQDGDLAVGAAIKESPDLMAASAGVAAAEKNLSGSKGRYHPRLDVRLATEYGNDIHRIQGLSRDTTAELVVSYNIFNGFADRAAVDEAGALLDVATHAREQRCRTVKQKVKIAHNDTLRLAEQLRLLEIQERSIDKARTAYFSQFRIGQRSLLDLLDTENEYFDTQRTLISTQAQLNVAQARTLAAIGRLGQSAGVAPAAFADTVAAMLNTDPGPNCPTESSENRSSGFADSDGDNVADNLDKCPSTPSGASVDASGCRENTRGDQDNDQVADGQDLCPNTAPGTVVDAAGCAGNQHVVLRGVNFLPNSSKLTPDSTIILDPVVKLLRANPTVRIEVSGHTDVSGAADSNLALSNARAAAVKTYLISEGIASERVAARGWGALKPIASNATPEGRSENRRVEFKVMAQKN